LQGDNYKGYRCLSGTFLAKAREVTPMYWRQLAHAARVKAAVVPY
jgi:hypothetical protein